MQKFVSMLIVGMLLVFSQVPSNATLLPSGSSGVIYDDVAKKFWQTNVFEFVDKTYQEQMLSIDNLSDLGLDWHLATGNEVSDLWLGNGDGFLNMFDGPGMYTGRVDTVSTSANFGDWENPGPSVAPNGVDSAHMVAMFGWDGVMLAGNSGFNWFVYDSIVHTDLGAWVVADALHAPEPSAVMLWVLGLGGVLVSSAIQRKQSKHKN